MATSRRRAVLFAVLGIPIIFMIDWVIVRLRVGGERAVSGTTAASATEARSPQERRLRSAIGAWLEFDDLRGDDFRTLAMLQAFRLKASVGIEMLPNDEADYIRAYNGREFRKRAATLLVPGESSFAYDDEFETLVPSLDWNRCEKLRAAWMKPPASDQITAGGFKRIACIEEHDK